MKDHSTCSRWSAQRIGAPKSKLEMKEMKEMKEKRENRLNEREKEKCDQFCRENIGQIMFVFDLARSQLKTNNI